MDSGPVKQHNCIKTNRVEILNAIALCTFGLDKHKLIHNSFDMALQPIR